MVQESERRANILSQQEEEMRQNAEELQATQEELERQRSSMHKISKNSGASLSKRRKWSNDRIVLSYFSLIEIQSLVNLGIYPALRSATTDQEKEVADYDYLYPLSWIDQ